MGRNMDIVASENFRTGNWEWHNLLMLPCFLSSSIFHIHRVLWPLQLKMDLNAHGVAPPGLAQHPPRPCSAGRSDLAPELPSVPVPGPHRARQTCVSLNSTHTSSPCMPAGKENGSQGTSLNYKNCLMAFLSYDISFLLFNPKGTGSSTELTLHHLG